METTVSERTDLRKSTCHGLDMGLSETPLGWLQMRKRTGRQEKEHRQKSEPWSEVTHSGAETQL